MQPKSCLTIPTMHTSNKRNRGLSSPHYPPPKKACPDQTWRAEQSPRQPNWHAVPSLPSPVIRNQGDDNDDNGRNDPKAKLKDKPSEFPFNFLDLVPLPKLEFAPGRPDSPVLSYHNWEAHSSKQPLGPHDRPGPIRGPDANPSHQRNATVQNSQAGGKKRKRPSRLSHWSIKKANRPRHFKRRPWSPPRESPATILSTVGSEVAVHGDEDDDNHTSIELLLLCWLKSRAPGE